MNLDLEEIIPVSGEHNVGITALLDATVKDMNKNEDEGLNDKEDQVLFNRKTKCRKE